MHALSARPHIYRVGGRGWSLYMDGIELYFLFRLLVYLGSRVGRWLAAAVKNHKVTFPLSYFCMTKSTKSQQGGLTPSSFRTSCGVHELVAGSGAWRVRAANGKVKIGGFAILRNLNHTTRANMSHEIAEQICARIACTPAYIGLAGVGVICAPTE